MSSCPCSPSALTAVRLGERVVLLRCSTHEQQAWQVDGRPADRAEALGALRTVFVDERGHRRSGAAVTRRPVRSAAPAPPADEVPAGAPDDAALTALLRARGLPGTWAVA